MFQLHRHDDPPVQYVTFKAAGSILGALLSNSVKEAGVCGGMTIAAIKMPVTARRVSASYT